MRQSSRPDLQQLLEAARLGDRAAIEGLLAVSQPDIRRYARINCVRASDVDDAVQDALWILYRHIGSLRVITSFSAWLMIVVRRECFRLARRAIGKAEPIDAFADDARLAAMPNDEIRMDLVAAIQSLPDQYRDIIILRDVEECTIDEIAHKKRLSREAVKGRLHRARALVREYVRENEAS